MKKILFLIAIIIILSALAITIIYTNKYVKTASIPSVNIDEHVFNVLTATTLDEQKKGLGNRASLDQNSGMLFIFNMPGNYGFWMKDMEFPLDIIYINNNKIISIFTLKKPNSNSQLQIVYPQSPSKYVLEINAGLSKKYNFKIGDAVKINL